ncbi:MAG: MipA/OmpV family protein [Flavobacteriales bacterium]
MKILFKTAICIVVGLISNTMYSQDSTPPPPKKVNYSVGLGFGVIPQYEGASDYRVLPFPMFSANWKTGQYVRLIGLDLESNFSKNRTWEYGLKLSFRPGRNSDLDDRQVSDMKNIDFSTMGGGFVLYRFAKTFDIKAEYKHDLSGVSNGGLGRLELGYSIRKQKTLSRISINSNFGTSQFMNTYFGVNPENIDRSTLSYYAVDGGIKDIGFAFNSAYFLNKKWILSGQLGMNFLIGDLVDGPILEGGSQTQISGGFAIIHNL